MQLQAYLTRESISYTDFAKKIGSDHARTVERYAKGQRFPSPAMLAKIREHTSGEVTADDFVPAEAE